MPRQKQSTNGPYLASCVSTGLGSLKTSKQERVGSYLGLESGLGWIITTYIYIYIYIL